MNDKAREPIRHDLRSLTSFELQVRNLAALEPHLQRVLAEAEDRHFELVEHLRRQLAFCETESLLDAAVRLRNALESEQ